MTYKEVLEQAGDVDACLLKHNIHFLTGEIAELNVSNAIKWIVFENLNPKPDKILTLYINSHGGELYQAFGLIDVMNHSAIPVRTVGIGQIMSAAFLILASGEKGHRYIAPNTGIMCHQYSEDMTGKHHDIKAAMAENDNCNERMVKILAHATGLNARAVKSKLLPASDVYLTANDIIQIGVADHLYQP